MTKKTKEKGIPTKQGDIPEDGDYQRLTDQQVKDLALGMLNNTIFTSMQMSDHEQNLLQSVFMPLVFLDDVWMKRFQAQKITNFYGDMKNAMPRSINGLPIFSSMGTLDREDTMRVCEKFEAIKEAMDKV